MIWWHWLVVHLSQETGTSSSTSRAYNWWSGFGGFTTLAVSALLFVWRQRECHSATCHRLAHHTTSGGYRLCKRCVAFPLETLGLHPIHEDHL